VRNFSRRQFGFPASERTRGRSRELSRISCEERKLARSWSWRDPAPGREASPRCARIVPDEDRRSGGVLLVDTSVWIEVFRKPPRLRLEEFTEFDEVATCLPVVQEVLQGFRDEGAFRIAREGMLALPVVESPLRRPVFEEAVALYRSARRAGLTIRSGVDCLIAVCAIRHGLTVVHHDRDFGLLERVSPLASRDPLA
jgi:hypothetical protein